MVDMAARVVKRAGRERVRRVMLRGVGWKGRRKKGVIDA